MHISFMPLTPMDVSTSSLTLISLTSPLIPLLYFSYLIHPTPPLISLPHPSLTLFLPSPLSLYIPYISFLSQISLTPLSPPIIVCPQLFGWLHENHFLATI